MKQNLPTLLLRARRIPGLAILGALAMAPAALVAQTSESKGTPAPVPTPGEVAAASTPASSSPASETVQLNPFEVQADKDNSYGALNSNSITRFNTELDKMPISADIYDQAFMKDVAADSVEAMIQTYSAGAGYSGADPGGSAATQQPGDRNGNSYLTLRGFQTPSMLRDAFMPVGSQGNPGSTGVGMTSNFDIERVELINGPQALLYGQGGAGGVINVTSKQARLGAGSFGELMFRVNQYGAKEATVDYGAGNDVVAVRVSLLNESNSGRRENIGGPLQGYYTQLAFHFFNTTFRVTAEETAYNRINSNDSSFTALSTTNDSRNGEKLNYILATNQVFQSTTGTGSSGAGPIDNGLINWSNVNSYEGQWASEYTLNQFYDLTADSKWTSWLSTQFAVGYNDYYDDRVNESFAFYAPNSTAGMPGVWSAHVTPTDTTEPVYTKGIRFTALLDNNFWGVRSQTVLGADDIISVQGEFAYEYFQADSNFNVITSPTVTTLNGRTAMPALAWSVDNGPVLYNLFSPRATQATVNGVNYVRMLQNQVSPAAVSPADPLGVTLGGANYSINSTTNEGIFGVNYSQWFNGKLDTLVGFRAAKNLSSDENQGSAPPSPPNAYRPSNQNAISYDAGVDYNVNQYLHPYVAFSDSFDPPVSESADPYGVLPLTAHGVGEELGLKFNNASKSLSGTLTLYHASSTNEQLTLSSTIENDVNPSGLNGRWMAPNQWTNVDRDSQGVQLQLTAAPTPNWRMRFTAAEVGGTMGSTRSWGQLYNDQFNENAAGQVTYADGNVVYVNPTYNSKQLTVTPTTAGAIPLTVALLNNTASPYFANPTSVNGQLTSSSAVYNVLKNGTDPLNPGSGIPTGVTGLPISAAQYNVATNTTNTGYIPPPGVITGVESGDITTGYPKYAFTFTTNYTFSRGFIKGLQIGGTARGFWKYADYYYYVNGVAPGSARIPFYLPNQGILDVYLGYTRKFGRIVFDTRLNVTNVLNHYDIILLPGENTGYTSTGTDATFNTQPRAYTWTNRISF